MHRDFAEIRLDGQFSVFSFWMRFSTKKTTNDNKSYNKTNQDYKINFREKMAPLPGAEEGSAEKAEQKVSVHLPDIEAILNLNPKLYQSKSVPTQVGKKAKAHWKRNITKSQGCDQSSGCGTG